MGYIIDDLRDDAGPSYYPATMLDDAAEITALRARVAELEKRDACSHDLAREWEQHCKIAEADRDTLRARVKELEERGRALLDAAERHIFSTECQDERDAFRALLTKEGESNDR